MLKNAIYIAASCYLSLLLTELSYAEEGIEQTDLRLVITGNTVEGKEANSNARFKMYFHPSGKLYRHDTNKNIQQGAWRIINTADLCITFAEEKCQAAKKRAAGQFDFYSVSGELAFTIDKVILGNPGKVDALTVKK